MLVSVGGDKKINLDNDREAIGKRIASLREERGWRQIDLAHRAGLSPSTITLYEREGPPVKRLNLLDAVFGGALLRGTALETLSLNGVPSPEPASTSRTIVLDLTRDDPKVTDLPVRDFVAPLDPDSGISPDHAADQDSVTGGVEPLGLLFDEVFGRLRALERAVADLEKGVADQ